MAPRKYTRTGVSTYKKLKINPLRMDTHVRAYLHGSTPQNLSVFWQDDDKIKYAHLKNYEDIEAEAQKLGLPHKREKIKK